MLLGLTPFLQQGKYNPMGKNISIKACVFDAYGTLFDVHSAVAENQGAVGAKADQVSAMWRTKQLEYTWLRSLMGRYVDFEKVTADALSYALETFNKADSGLHGKLMGAYRSLSCYPEVPEVLQKLGDAGLQRAILSNGSPDMLNAAVDSSGLNNSFESVISVDGLKIYKPTPAVYKLCCDQLSVNPGEILFHSSNAWDAVGAKSFGFNVAWINRFGQPREKLDHEADYEFSDLTQALNLVV